MRDRHIINVQGACAQEMSEIDSGGKRGAGGGGEGQGEEERDKERRRETRRGGERQGEEERGSAALLTGLVVQYCNREGDCAHGGGVSATYEARAAVRYATVSLKHATSSGPVV